MKPSSSQLVVLLACGIAVVAGCSTQLKVFDQCGGTANCEGARCGDNAWAGYCCPSSALCTRANGFYYQCLPKPGVNVASDAPSNAADPPRNAPRSAANAPAPVVGNPPRDAVVAAPPQEPVAARMKGGSYDYGQVLGLSLKFYEAQRSGKLPKNNRIKWRGDSGLNDRAPDGRDVTGGWYDAGDNVKFNLPMAWSAGVLAWSLVDFEAGYKAAGEYKNALDAIKWVTDYFIKCIGNGQTDIMVQVGNGAQDHGVWGRPEDVNGPVPVYVVTPEQPGSDVVGAMGAALAAASVAFKKVDAAYSQKLLAASLKAYKFASTYQGKYSVAVPDAAAFYPSSNYMDDVAFNALWLYLRTGDAKYKAEGLAWYMKHYNQEEGKGVWNNFDWDSNSWGAALLLTRLFPNNPLPAERLTTFVNAWTKGVDGVTYTPKGLAFSGPWGSLRHTGNAMFLMKAYAKSKPLAPAAKRSIDCTVKQQLGYILGDAGRSFVVGYGVNPPTQPHHRGSSCPSPITSECSWDAFNSKDPNPQTLYGALVGGPGADDSYVDARNDFIKNEVATDYNAGLTGALAAAELGLKC